MFTRGYLLYYHQLPSSERFARPDTLDPALLRSGRLDRKIELPHPNEVSRHPEMWGSHIFQSWY